MDKNDVLEIYDEDYAQEYNQRFILNERSKNNADFEQKTINKLLSEIGEGAKWLDVACGTGYFLSCFPGVERAGLDISPAMLKVAKQANPNALFVQGDYRDKLPQWEGKWDLVSCMWWAYCYIESLSELEKVVENLADWTSERGVCFLPVCDPAELGASELKLPYTSKNMGEGGGYCRFEGVIWSWIDEESGKQHLNLLAPQVEYMISLFKKHFEQVEIIEYPLFKGGKRKAIVARSKKQKYTLETEVVGESESTGLFSSFSKIIRGGNWWLYKIPPLLAIAYGEMILMGFPAIQSILTVLALLFSISSVAAYGHIVNDIFDIEVDGQVGKSNAMTEGSSWQRVLFCAIFVIAGFVFPVTLNFGIASSVLLGINYLLPTIYSAPPLRLKEKGIFGVISDAAGAHAIPTLFFAATFLHLSTTPQPEAFIFSIAATAWSFSVGVRGILLHQLWDRENDLKSGVKTLVTNLDVEEVRFWITFIIFPVEILLLSILVLVISQFVPLLLVFFILYISIKGINTKLELAFATAFETAPVEQVYVFPHDLYDVWFPLVLATLLTGINVLFLIVLIFHIILFYKIIKLRVTEFILLLSSWLKLIKITLANEPDKEVDNFQASQRLEINSDATISSLNQVDTKENTEQIQGLLNQTQAQLQQTQEQLKQIQYQLQQTQEKLIPSESELQTSQTELALLLSYLQQTQGVEGLMSYYRSRIASHPDDIQLYHQALTMKPDDGQIHLQLGNALVRQNRFCDALALPAAGIATYQTALQFHPNNFEIHLELAKTLEKEKKWDEAIASYRCAIELNPDYSWSHKHLGDVLAKQGQINEASVCYRCALQLQPRIF